MVLDPFAGCATACVSPFQKERQCAEIDVSSNAFDRVCLRVAHPAGGTLRPPSDEANLPYSITQRMYVPQRTDLGAILCYNDLENKTRLYDEQEVNCAGCNTHFEALHLTIDHIIPRTKGGTDHLGNLLLLCGNCNAIKGNRGMEYLVARLAQG